MTLSHLASERLTRDQHYTRAELKQLFGFSDTSLETGVFRPSGYNSVWLFVTALPSTDGQPTTQLVDEDTITWVSAGGARSHQLVVTHELRGLELLIFYREAATPLAAGFRYLGQFEYQRSTISSPAILTLTRSGSQPSLALLQAIEDRSSVFNPQSVSEGRERVLSSVVRRRGQAAFRNSLLAAYEGACAITACQVEPILEAAHIIPYLGPTTNHIQNGLLLRADIHTLFDLQLLAIEPNSLTVAIAPSLLNSEYAPLTGCSLRLPSSEDSHPSRDALRAHRIRCHF